MAGRALPAFCLAPVSAGAGAGLAAYLSDADPSPAGLALGAVVGLLAGHLEAAWRWRPGLLALAYGPFLPLLALPWLVRNQPLPLNVASTFPGAVSAAGPLIARYLGGILLLGAIAASAGIRSWGFGKDKERPLLCRPGLWVGIGTGLSAAVFATLACLAFRSFHKYIDLAVENEVVFHLSRGQGPMTFLHETFPTFQHPNYWGTHLTLMWALVAPLYRLWSSPCLLLILQAVLVSAAAVPIYLALKPRIGSSQAAILALAYLLYPTTQHAMLHELHGISWAVPFTAGAWWAWQSGRRGWAAILALLAFSCREEILLVSAGLGLCLLVRRGHRFSGLAVLLASALAFHLLLNHLMPSLGQSGDWRTYKFKELGATNAEIARTLLTRPLYTLRLLITPDKLANLAIFLLPLAFLPLAGWASWRVSLAAAPIFLALFLSGNAAAYCYLLFYTLPAIPFLILGAGEGLLFLERRGGERLRRAGLSAVLAASLAASVLFGPSPLGRTFWDRTYPLGAFQAPYHHRSIYAQTEHARIGRQLLDRIPPDAVVSAQAFFLPHLASRTLRMQCLPRIDTAGWVLLDPAHPNRYELAAPGAYTAFVEGMRRDPAWTLAEDRDGYLLFRRLP